MLLTDQPVERGFFCERKPNRNFNTREDGPNGSGRMRRGLAFRFGCGGHGWNYGPQQLQ